MKVGKAIYNILSQSKDVQSNFPFNTTDYSPTGTELVTNGSFTDTGSELVTNGDFASGTGWTFESGWALGTNEAVATATTNQLYQDVSLVNGKSYKITYEVQNWTSGTLYLYLQTNGYIGSGAAENKTITEYITYEGSDGRIYFRGSSPVSCAVTNITVKELGEGWSLHSNTEPIFNASGVTLNTSNGFDQTIRQSNVILSAKSYKVTYQITAATYTTGSRFDYYDGDSYVAFPEQGVGTHTFYYTSPSVASDRWYMKLKPGSGTDEVTLSSISVEEMAVNKIFPELAPPDIDAPYVVYSVVSNSPSETKNTNGDIDTASIEVYGFQDTYNKAVDLGVSVRAALDRKTGTYNTIEIQSTNYVNEQMDVNEARKLWAAIQDYSIRIKNL